MRSIAGLFHLPVSRPKTATEWAVRLRSPEATEQDRAAFEGWLASDPANLEAFHRSKNLSALADRARAQHEMVSELIADASGDLRDGAMSPAPIRRQPWPAAIAAAFVALAVALTFQFSGSLRDSGIATKPGEQRTVMLEDGSTIQLNTDSRASYLIDAHTRRVALTRGEAFFDVAKDPARPFVVQAGRSEVRVLGTQFTVRHVDDRIEVVVKEGRVEVVPGAAAYQTEAVERIELVPGNRAELDNRTVKVASVDVERVMAWRSGEIEFRSEPLEEVLAELNRYSITPMVIEDESLKSLRVSGRFKVADHQSIRFMLSESLGVQFIPRDDRIGLSAKR